MKRLVILALALVLPALPAPVAGQDGETPTRVYISYWQVNYGDVMEWMELYRDHWEPIVQEMVDEGRLLGHNALIHNTGGIYNFRMAMQGTQDTNFDRVVTDLIERWSERDPSSFARSLELTRGHDDEVWNIDQTSITQGTQWRYMYENSVQVPYEHWLTFTDRWNDALGETLEQARADGILTGWVVETHNTGGRFNWKVLLLVPTWNDLGELQERFYEAVPLDHPIWSYWDAHKDELWEQMPAPGGE